MRRFLDAELIIVMTIVGLVIFSSAILTPVLPLYLTSMNIAPLMLGLIFSVCRGGLAIGEVSWGWVADKAGLKVPLNAGAFVYGVVVLLFFLAKNVPAVFLVCFFFGIARAASLIAGRGYMAVKAPLSEKAAFMAILTAVTSSARSLGSLMSGFIADIWGYQWVFLISSGISLLGGLVFIPKLRRLRLVRLTWSERSAPLYGRFPNPTQPWSYRSATSQGIVAALQFIGLGVMITFLPLLAVQVVGTGVTGVGVLFGIQGLVGLLVVIPSGRLADRKGKRFCMIFGLLGSALAMVGLTFVRSYPWLAVLVIIYSLSMALFGPAALALLSDSVPPRRQSTSIGVYGLCEDMGMILGSGLGGYISSALGLRTSFFFGSLAASLGALLCFGLIRNETVINR